MDIRVWKATWQTNFSNTKDLGISMEFHQQMTNYNTMPDVM
jgi:hypothetical protein